MSEFCKFTYDDLIPRPPVPVYMCSIPQENYDYKDYFFRENNAYTVDNVLIYNIFVYSIPVQFTEDDVRHYFSKFGNVLAVKFVEYKIRGASKVGFVNFAEPEGACSVLQKTTHHLQGLRIGVMAGDSWNQPSTYKACDPTKNENDVITTAESLSKITITTYGGADIFSLNDNCIEAIFGNLNSREQVRLARVCERFEDIFQMYYRRQSKNFGLSNISEMTLWEIRDFCRLVGRNMTSLTGIVPYKNRERIVEFIRQFCEKIKCIRLEKSNMRIEYLKRLLRAYPQLKELTLRNSCLNDNYIETMTHLNRLKTLDLAENYDLTGKFIRNFVQLRVLNLYGCYNIEPSNLEDICKSLPHLRSLDIRRVGGLSATFFNVMVEHCKELEILKISCPEFPYERVVLLPRLKQLELHCDFFRGTVEKSLLAELVEHKADQLEVLKITTSIPLRAEQFNLISKLKQLKKLFVPYNDINDDALIKFCKLQQLEDLTIQSCKVTNEGLLNLVKSCPRLRRLNIKFCEQITIEFLLETIRFLKGSEKRKTPLVLLAYCTAIEYYDACEYEEFKEAQEQSLIKVIFHTLSLDVDLEDGVDIYDLWDGERWYDEDNEDNEDNDQTEDDGDVYFTERKMDADDMEFDYEIFAQILLDDDDGNDIWLD